MSGRGLAGNIAYHLIDSPLVPLILMAALLLGIWGLLVTPREDRPRIDVPTAIITVSFPGAGPEVIDEQVARAVGSWARQLEDVTEVRSLATADAAVVLVEFGTRVGDPIAFARLRELLDRNAHLLPPGAGAPEVQTIGDERLAILLITLYSDSLDGYRLRRLGEELAARLETVAGVRAIEVHGGEPRQVEVRPRLTEMASREIALPRLIEALAAADVRLPAAPLRGEQTLEIAAGALLRSAEDVARVQVGAGPGGVIYVGDVADVVDGPAPAESQVVHWQATHGSPVPAVTLAVSSVPRRNVSDVTQRTLARLDELRPTLIPHEVFVQIGYDAGKDATDRVYSVLWQLLIGTVIVIGIIGLALGWRAAVVVALIIPTSLAIVPAIYYWAGFSLNPVSIAAMILAIGILADDAIIMLENIVRRFRQHGQRSRELVVQAVSEVGNPTILADLLIVVTLLPTAFITGEMGQYVRAIPVGAASAVLFSLGLALVATPYLGLRLVRPPPAQENREAGRREGREGGATHEAEQDRRVPDTGRLLGFYRRLLTFMVDHAAARWLLYGLMALALVGALLLVPLRLVQVGLVPLLDRETFAVNLRLPPGTPLEETLAAAASMGRFLQTVPEVEAYTIYAGTAGPQLFPFTRLEDMQPRNTHEADVYVQLPPEDQRHRQSYEVGRALQRSLPQVLSAHQARGYVRRIPSGPSMERDLSAELFGPDLDARLRLAQRVEQALQQVPAVVAIQRIPEDPLPRLDLTVDQTSAAAYGVPPAEVAQTLRVAIGGATAARLHAPAERHPVPVMVRLDRGDRDALEDLAAIYLPGAGGAAVPLFDLVTVRPEAERLPRQRRDLLPVVYVAADLDRTVSQPVSVQWDTGRMLADDVHIEWFGPPEQVTDLHLHWGGDWTMTREVYRDLAIAGLAVLLFVYVILAGWFGSYTAPLIIMLPVPLVFIGVVPAHWLWGLDIVGLSVLGMIALVGIVARNAVLLVGFIRERTAEDMPLRDAVVDAGLLRARPILLAAITVFFGSGVLIFEPALEPLGLTLASGVLVSTLLTLVLIPALYYHLHRGREGATSG